MFLLDWYRDFLTIRMEFKERKLGLPRNSEPEICQSCEVLKELLIQSESQKMRILDKALKEPTQMIEPPQVAPPIAIKSAALPWRIRQQHLEREDRHKAQLLKDAPKPNPITTDAEMKEFEKELKDAEQRREAQKSS